MTSKDEALKLALDVLVEINKLSIGENAISLPAEIDTAIDAAKEALAQPEQKPLTGGDERWHVICLCPDCTKPARPDFYIIEPELEALQRDGRRAVVLYTKPVTNGIDVPVYTTPPQRESLTDDAKDAMRYRWLFNDVDLSAIKTAFDENKPPPSSSHSQIIEQIIGFYVNKQDVDEMIDWAIKAAQGVKE